MANIRQLWKGQNLRDWQALVINTGGLGLRVPGWGRELPWIQAPVWGKGGPGTLAGAKETS